MYLRITTQREVFDTSIKERSTHRAQWMEQTVTVSNLSNLQIPVSISFYALHIHVYLYIFMYVNGTKAQDHFSCKHLKDTVDPHTQHTFFSPAFCGGISSKGPLVHK